MSKQGFSHSVVKKSKDNLYTIEDIRHVNAMQIKYCKSEYMASRVQVGKGSRHYSAAELNAAWSSVSK